MPIHTSMIRRIHVLYFYMHYTCTEFCLCRCFDSHCDDSMDFREYKDDRSGRHSGGAPPLTRPAAVFLWCFQVNIRPNPLVVANWLFHDSSSRVAPPGASMNNFMFNMMIGVIDMSHTSPGGLSAVPNCM